MDKTMIKEARHDMNRVGVTMLVYYALMNVVAVLVLIADLVGYLTQLLISGQNLDPDAMMQYIMDGAMNNGWMYIMSIAIGLLVVLFWKGKGYWRREVFVKNNPMTVGSFFSLLCVFLSAQFFFQMFSLTLEWLLNQIGFSAMAAVEMASTTGSTFSMYIYICFLGPIAEELLFRGIVLRTLRPWGKQAAILISALVFGLFHGNVVQIPFAFAVGVIERSPQRRHRAGRTGGVGGTSGHGEDRAGRVLGGRDSTHGRPCAVYKLRSQGQDNRLPFAGAGRAH
jgi:membrane protease YdiL (CAAX protease family)